MKGIGVGYVTARAATVVFLAVLLGACAPLQVDGVDARDRAEQAAWQWRDSDESWTYRGERDVPRIPAESWQFESNAITLNVEAEYQLNMFDGAPHTLVLRVMQLNGPRDFSDKRGTRTGLRSLLLTDDPEEIGAGVVELEELVIRPGETTTRVFDRYGETRYFAIVAGYYDLKRDRVTRLASFPALDDSEEVRYGLFDAITFGLFAGDEEEVARRPGRLEINLKLESDGIREMEIEPR